MSSECRGPRDPPGRGDEWGEDEQPESPRLEQPIVPDADKNSAYAAQLLHLSRRLSESGVWCMLDAMLMAAHQDAEAHKLLKGTAADESVAQKDAPGPGSFTGVAARMFFNAAIVASRHVTAQRAMTAADACTVARKRREQFAQTPLRPPQAPTPADEMYAAGGAYNLFAAISIPLRGVARDVVDRVILGADREHYVRLLQASMIAACIRPTLAIGLRASLARPSTLLPDPVARSKYDLDEMGLGGLEYGAAFVLDLVIDVAGERLTVDQAHGQCVATHPNMFDRDDGARGRVQRDCAYVRAGLLLMQRAGAL